jgi:hypothetical protein
MDIDELQQQQRRRQEDEEQDMDADDGMFFAAAYVSSSARARRRTAVTLSILAYAQYRRVLRLEPHVVPAVPRFEGARLLALPDRECFERFRCEALLAFPRWSDFIFPRFLPHDIVLLATALRLPAFVRTSNRLRASREEALSITLWRLAYPNRLHEGVAFFGRSFDQLSRIALTVVLNMCAWCPKLKAHVRQVFAFLWTNFEANVRGWDHQRLTLARLDVRHLLPLPRKLSHSTSIRTILQTFAQAIEEKGSPLSRCFGFLDGTLCFIDRPGQFQRQVYSGHKRRHALVILSDKPDIRTSIWRLVWSRQKYQGVFTPDGICVSFSGPHLGRRHDARMLTDSGLLPLLQAHAVAVNNDTYYVYGDAAYAMNGHVIGPMRGMPLTQFGNHTSNDGVTLAGNPLGVHQQIFNSTMSKLRVSAEWGFQHMKSQFAFVNYDKDQKLYLSPVGKIVFSAMLLANCHVCLYNCQTAMFFNIQPPTLAEYLNTL